MDAQMQTLILQLLQQTADGMVAAVHAPQGESTEHLQARMELSVKRLACIADIMQRGMATPDELASTLWEDREDERSYQERDQHTMGVQQLDLD
jgi:hypothetical protein